MREILESDAKRRIRKRSIFLGFFVVQDGFKKLKIQRFSGRIISRGKVVQNIYAFNPPTRSHAFFRHKDIMWRNSLYKIDRDIIQK